MGTSQDKQPRAHCLPHHPLQSAAGGDSTNSSNTWPPSRLVPMHLDNLASWGFPGPTASAPCPTSQLHSRQMGFGLLHGHDMTRMPPGRSEDGTLPFVSSRGSLVCCMVSMVPSVTWLLTCWLVYGLSPWERRLRDSKGLIGHVGPAPRRTEGAQWTQVEG